MKGKIGSTTIVGATAIKTKEWEHIALVYDMTSCSFLIYMKNFFANLNYVLELELSVYLNGVRGNTATNVLAYAVSFLG